MARPVEWFQRLPQILELLHQPQQPASLNRQALQDLFGVERRNAQYLMTRFGATRLGNALVIDRQQLIDALSDLVTADDFDRQQRRQDRVQSMIAERRRDLRLARIALADPPASPPGQLPSTIRLDPGRLSIHFADAVDLLSQLLVLSRSIGNDFERFEGLLNRDPLVK